MKKLVLLTAFALGTVMMHQASACDWGAHAANAAQDIAACQGDSCKDQASESTTQEPMVATAEPAAAIVADAAVAGAK
jgi:hypothetical protein